MSEKTFTEKRGATLPDIRKTDPAKFRERVKERELLLQLTKAGSSVETADFLAGIRFAMRTLWELEKEAISGKHIGPAQGSRATGRGTLP